MNQIPTYISEIILQNLENLKKEIKAFPNDQELWKTKGQVTNSAGVLCQHLCGNLNHFIGAILGNTGYVRDRDSEFKNSGQTREELVKQVEETINTVKITLEKIDSGAFDATYPIPFLGKKVATGELAIILVYHLGYHLGQINYLRRMEIQ